MAGRNLRRWRDGRCVRPGKPGAGSDCLPAGQRAGNCWKNSRAYRRTWCLPCPRGCAPIWSTRAKPPHQGLKSPSFPAAAQNNRRPADAAGTGLVQAETAAGVAALRLQRFSDHGKRIGCRACSRLEADLIVFRIMVFPAAVGVIAKFIGVNAFLAGGGGQQGLDGGTAPGAQQVVLIAVESPGSVRIATSAQTIISSSTVNARQPRLQRRLDLARNPGFIAADARPSAHSHTRA